MTAITLAVNNGHITVTSRQIAEHFGKLHGHVLRAIANLDCSPEFRQSNFGSAHYLDEQGKPRQEYTLTRDGFTFLCMGFTGKEAAQWKERYIAAFNEMDAQLHGVPALPHLITIAQQGELATLIAERFPVGKDRPYAWSRFNKHFRVNSYKNLPADKFNEECSYIVQMPAKVLALPAPETSAEEMRKKMVHCMTLSSITNTAPQTQRSATQDHRSLFPSDSPSRRLL